MKKKNTAARRSRILRMMVQTGRFISGHIREFPSLTRFRILPDIAAVPAMDVSA
jgi:hypothetical protein